MALPLLALAVVAFLLALPILGQPWTIDEPAFLAVARHILQDPLHPYAFDFNWYGRYAPMSQVDGNPPLFPYLLALCWKVAGGQEWAVRLALWPLELASAFALYGLASRFVRRPLWPALALVAAPAFAINMPHAMPENLLAALVFPALYCALRGADEKDDRFLWASAALFSGALLTKYAGAFLLAPAVLYALERGVERRKLAGFLLVACGPLAAYLLRAHHGGGLVAAGHLLWATKGNAYAAPLERLRSALAFAGGLGLAAGAWSLARPRWQAPMAGAIFSALLFLPAAAAWPAKLQGLFFSAAALWALEAVWSEGDFFLKAWTACGFLLVLGYWSVTARTTLFVLPPLTFAAARRLEARFEGWRLIDAYLASVVALAGLTLTLARVDASYARAQKSVAELMSRGYAGRTVWCASHWGLQHYLLEAGARELDWTRGGWDEAGPGDVVVMSRVNANVLLPEKEIMADMRTISAESSIPLRLISRWGGQAGFYSSKNGFLPFAVSREPLDEFLVAKILPPAKVLHAVHSARTGPGL